jgi:acetyltransferase-like isoleucine patch superfamily enzyme
MLTHSIDVYNNRQDAKPIRIGKYCFVGTGCILLPGSELPDYSVLGAGAVLTKAHTKPGCLYAGSPAKEVKELDVDVIPYFKRDKHAVD